MKKRIFAVLLAAFMLVGALAGCSGSDNSTPSTSGAAPSGDGTSTPPAATGDAIQVEFWAGTEQMYYDFWTDYAAKFNDAGIQVDGKPVQVNVQQMPGQPSAEAGIQNAIATGTAPAISENINIGFAGTLAESDAIYDLTNEDWFKEIAAERNIEDVLKGWEIGGSSYVLPQYVNPMVLQYNSNVLRALDSDVPTTLDELNTLMEKFLAAKDEMSELGATHFMYRFELTRSDLWWERWFDFESFYEAFSGGQGLGDGTSLTMDPAISKQVFEVFGNMGNSLLIGEIPQIWQQDTVPVAMGIGLPWEINANDAAGKVYGIDGDYVFGPMITLNEGDTPYCYADTKGMVLYKTDNISEEQHLGAIEFVKWVYLGGGKDTYDVDWLKAVSMLPVRGDLADYEPVQTYLAESSPGLVDLSEYVGYARPGMPSSKESDMLIALSDGGMTAYILESTNTEPGNAPDATPFVESAIAAMKEAGGMS